MFLHVADISKAMQSKKKRLELLTKNSLKGSTQKLEQMWKTQQNQRLLNEQCMKSAQLLELGCVVN